MAERPPWVHKPEDEIEFTEAVSENNKKFAYALVHEGPGEDAPPDRATHMGTSFDVRWEVQDDETENETSSEIINHMGITAYLLENSNWIYRYKLNFYRVSLGTVFFRDEDGDCYEVFVIRRGWHTLRYDSPKPTIVRISRV